MECDICSKERDERTGECGCTGDISESELTGLLYGVVEWINGNPVLDGMPYFYLKEAALKYVTEREKMGSMGLPCTVEYKIIRLVDAT